MLRLSSGEAMKLLVGSGHCVVVTKDSRQNFTFAPTMRSTIHTTLVTQR